MSDAFDLETLLAQARHEGRVDSSGSFTLDLWGAQRKFREFLLSDPYRYILRLVRSAVFSGADSVTGSIGHDSVKLFFPSLPLKGEQLPTLLDRLLGAHGDAGRELAVGLNSLLALEPQKVELLLATGDGAHLLRLTPESEGELHHLPENRGPMGTYLNVQRSGGSLLKRLGEPQESQLLRELCRFCPIPLKINGKLVQPPYGRGRGPSRIALVREDDAVQLSPRWYLPASYFWKNHHAIEYRYYDPDKKDQIGLLYPSKASITLRENAPAQPSGLLETCQLVLAINCSSSLGNVVQLIHGGQSVAYLEQPFTLGAMEAVISCDGLTMDLTGEVPVRNEAFEKKLDFLLRCAFRLRTWMEKRYRGYPLENLPVQALYDRKLRGVHDVAKLDYPA